MTVDRALAQTSLGAAIHRRRVALGMSTVRLAEDVGVRPSDITRWERGEVQPPLTRVHALARALRIDAETTRLWLDSAAVVGDEPEVHIVIDLAPPDPFVIVGGTGVAPGRTQSSTERDQSRESVASKPVTTQRRPEPRQRTVPSVFPNPPGASLDRDRLVYSASAGVRQAAHPRLTSAGRLFRVTVALLVLGVALAWALGQLGDGFGDLINLFKGSGAAIGG